MSRTYRSSRLADAGILPADRILRTPKMIDLRQPGKVTKKFTHHRERRAVTREIAGELKEGV